MINPTVRLVFLAVYWVLLVLFLTGFWSTTMKFFVVYNRLIPYYKYRLVGAAICSVGLVAAGILYMIATSG
jgi:hypothetical protein